MLLTVALEQILDPEPPGELLTQAVAAGITGALFLGAGILLTALAAATSKRGEKLKTAKMVASLIAAPTGIALSLAASLGISAGAAVFTETFAGEAVAAIGLLCVAAGYFIDRGFWWKLIKAILAALRSASDDPNSSRNGAAPTQP